MIEIKSIQEIKQPYDSVLTYVFIAHKDDGYAIIYRVGNKRIAIHGDRKLIVGINLKGPYDRSN